MKTTFVSRTFIRPLILLALFVGLTGRAEDTLIRREWKVGGVTREALLHVPADAKTNFMPVVFAFHGHGGSMRRAATMFHIETLWPEAIVVYMQGLNTSGQLTDPEGKKPGWQKSAGDQNDRDLKFFDAVLASLKKDYKVNSKRIYSTGHSNGGAFTYLLWAERGEQFAAFAPSAALARSLVASELPLSKIEETSEQNKQPASDSASRKNVVLKPVLHVAGEKDPLVKFAWQKMMINGLLSLNGCGKGSPWKTDERCTIYNSKKNAPVVTYIHPGTHAFPSEAPELIVKFFKEHQKLAAKQE